MLLAGGIAGLATTTDQGSGMMVTVAHEDQVGFNCLS